jgi:hypothetical protein
VETKRAVRCWFAALVAAVVAKVTEQRVEAGTDGDVILGASNVVSATTSISTSPPYGGAALTLSSIGGTGLVSNGNTIAVHASSASQSHKQRCMESDGAAGAHAARHSAYPCCAAATQKNQTF